jgi:sugar transferase (PEP-CTERM system associated)
MIKVWEYGIIRLKGPLLAAQTILVGLIGLNLAWAQYSSVPALYPTIGLTLLLVLPQLSIYVLRSENAILSDDYTRFLSEMLAAVGTSLILAVLLFWSNPSLFPGPRGALAAVGISALIFVFLRLFLRWFVRHERLAERMLVLGSGEMAMKFYRDFTGSQSGLQSGRSGRTHSAAPKEERHENGSENPTDGKTVTLEQFREMTLRDGISRIVVAEPNIHASQALAVTLLDCKLRGLEVETAVESYERYNGKLWLEGIRPEWLVYSESFHPSKWFLTLKRFTDATLACLLLVVLSPVLILVALAVKLGMRGNILFRQERVGWRGRQFVLLKFRTMREEAEIASGPVWAGENDPRITTLGRWLRKSRLDELPQLLNVLRGEMSLVGPRPERPYFVKILQQCVPYYALRHCVRPGVTGWAQVLYPYGASVQDSYEKLQYDLYYVKHMSLTLDCLILLNTLRVVILGRGR